MIDWTIQYEKHLIKQIKILMNYIIDIIGIRNKLKLLDAAGKPVKIQTSPLPYERGALDLTVSKKQLKIMQLEAMCYCRLTRGSIHLH